MKFGGGLTPSAPTPANPKSNECLAVLPSLWWTRHFAAPHMHAASVRQAEGFPSIETAKACGLFSKWEDLIYKHLHAYFGF